MIKPGVPAPGFVKRIGAIVDERRCTEFRSLDSAELVNRLTDARMPFGWTVNPYRGCEFGCRYCYARPTHGYLGHANPEEFEQRIYVKRADDGRLVARLRKARESGEEVAIGTATDPYQPAEGRFGVTRSVLEAVRRVPGLRVGITTKSPAVTRDLELLREIAASGELIVNVSIASTDAALLRRIEPRAPRPDLRLAAMAELTAAGVATRLFAMPVLPYLTDGEAELEALFHAAREAGARVKVNETAKLAVSWDEAAPDENTAYYLAKLDDLYDKFRPLIEQDGLRPAGETEAPTEPSQATLEF